MNLSNKKKQHFSYILGTSRALICLAFINLLIACDGQDSVDGGTQEKKAGSVRLKLVDENGTYSFGNRPQFTETQRVLSILHFGNMQAQWVGAEGMIKQFSFVGGSFPGAGGTCTPHIIENCTIVVQFKPTSSSYYTDQLIVSYDTGRGRRTTSLRLEGTGVASGAALTISDGTEYDYGPRLLNSVTEKTFTISNSGNMEATNIFGTGLAAPFAFKGGSFPGTGGTCGIEIDNGSSCTMVVAYTPTDAVEHTDTISLVYFDGELTKTATRAVKGNGAASISSVAAGLSHTCALFSSGHVRCWGRGDSGQLGNGATSNSATPVTVTGIPTAGGETATAITAGDNHTCAILTDKTVLCWGANDSKQLGVADAGAAGDTCTVGAATIDCTGTPEAAAGIANVEEFAAGANHNCARITGDTAQCWGAGVVGQLGNALNANAAAAQDVQLVGGGGQLANVAAISAGGDHSCAFITGGTVNCWGNGDSGELGNNASIDTNTPVIVENNGGGNLTNIDAVSVGGEHSCAHTDSNTVKCWGSDSDGQIGNDDPILNVDQANLVDGEGGVGVLGNISSMSSGKNHTCALSDTSTIYCWGQDAFGQLGDGSDSSVDQSAPVIVPDVFDATGIVAGANHTCYYTSTVIKCWGANGFGQLGDAGATNQSSPVSVSGL